MYNNSTPIVNSIGSIQPGTTFENKTIQEMLDLILYPYVKIEVGSTATAEPSIKTYNVEDLPTLEKVILPVKQNSATNLCFEL
jgi:D-alanine-D-alanine ligase-like ATP-grasp enzyme